MCICQIKQTLLAHLLTSRGHMTQTLLEPSARFREIVIDQLLRRTYGEPSASFRDQRNRGRRW